ncbi:DUF4112 domain-containing protein [uncultured Tateyamaria sp.]|uniref:DUF4112 domain-containing protein n=1 Tax=uncultured Tateyamaria sp. TaxID=455651 RepID=UPI002627EA4A|nr:DUF4112 domain-containing protein [uncultured Tateyamaria sp.]
MPSISSHAADRCRRVARLQRLADTLDSRFRIFGIPIGWDSVLGLIPGIGALVTLIPGTAMVLEGARMGARKRVLSRMALNTGADVVIGAIPILGDVFDIFFRSHQRSVAMLQREAERLEQAEQQSP